MTDKLTHILEDGSISMVDVSEKQDTARIAVYEIFVNLSKTTYNLLKKNGLPKGDALNTAKVAGILAAKNTSHLIPLTHPLPLTYLDVKFYLNDQDFSIRIEAEARTTAKTGVEIEAMVAAHIAAITIHDMCKAVQKDILISNGKLIYKSGGKSGEYKHSPKKINTLSIYQEIDMKKEKDSTPLNQIRNFSIIAHIDHGKSTLADRILEITKLVSKRELREQFLDRLDLERERGITIKSQTVRIPHTHIDGQRYVLNLIDTPGHVDFNYEVSRSLAACECAVLLVDATQGVEAQTLANVYLALEHDLEIIPVLNKIDLPSAEPDRVIQEIEEAIGLDCTDIIMVSAKTGENVDKLIDAIIKRCPPPQGDFKAPLKALIFDSWYDPYLG